MLINAKNYKRDKDLKWYISRDCNYWQLLSSQEWTR